MATHTPDVRTVIDRFNEAFQSHRAELLRELVADDCVLENTAPAPDGDRRVGREACLALWQGIASDRNGRFDVEEVRLLDDLSAQGPVVTGMHLLLRADVPGLDELRFQALAQEAKENCLVSRLLKTGVTLEARLWTEDSDTTA